MIVENKKLQKHKAKILTSVMKDRDLMNTMFDAWEAPIGSTKRQKARGILKSVSKAHENYSRMNDGQGGGFDAFNYKGGIFDNNPTAAAGILQTPAQQKATKPTLSNYAPTFSDKPQINAEAIKASLASKKNIFVNSIDDLKVGTGTGSIAGTDKTGTVTGGTGYYIDKNGNIKLGIAGIDFETISPTKVKTTAATPTKTTATTTVKPTGEFVGPPSPSKLPADSTDDMFDETTTATQYIQKLKDTYGDGSMQTWYNSLDAASKKALKPAYDAVNSGIGKTTFAYQIMSDKNAFAKLLGVPVAALSEFPDSGELKDQLLDIYRTTRKANDLDNLEKKYTDMLYSGNMATETLQTYIKNKDSYMGDIDELIDKAESNLASTDTSNPTVANRMANYNNYLYTLKNRQNTRYLNMVDLGIKQYTAKFNTLEAQYKMNYQNMQDQYKIEAAGATDTFNNMKTMIEEMYTNVESRYSNFKDSASLQYDILKNVSSLMTDEVTRQEKEANIKKLNAEANGTNYEKYDSSNIDSLLGIVVDKATGKVVDMTSYDPIAALYNTSSGGQNPLNIMNRFKQATEQNVSNTVSTGALDSIINKYRSSLGQYLSTSDANQRAVISQTADSVESGIRTGLSTYFSSSEDITSKIRDVIKDLVKFKGTKEEWLSGKGWFRSAISGIDPDIASALYDYYAKVKASGANAFEGIDQTSDSALKSELASELAGSIRYDIAPNF